MGDLAENAEYHEARQAQGEIEDRISHLENLIKTALIVDEKTGDIVTIGTSVKVIKEGENDAKSYKIVGSEEADMASGKLSNLSPLGTALIGRKKGDSFSFTTPKGKANYTLISIE